MDLPKTLTRTLTLDVRAADGDDIPVVISTDVAIERDGYREVLDHSPGAIDLSRAPLPIIESHNGKMVNIGIVDKLKPVGGKLRGMARFGKTARAKELVEDIKGGIVRSVSIAYQILAHRVDGDTLIATRWMPYETSILAIPADINAGFYRSKDMTTIDNIEAVRSQDEAKRVRTISAAAHQFRQHDLGQRAIAEGWPMEKFQRAMLDSYSARPVQTESSLGLTENERRDFSFVKLLRHIANPTDKRARYEAGYELEIVSGSEKGEGYRIPAEVLGKRDLTVAGTTTGSKLVPTDHLGGQFTEMLRNRLVIAQAGATFLSGLSGNVAIPRQTGQSNTYWVAEGNPVTESNPTFDQITMAPKTVGTFVDLSRKLLIQSSPDVEQLIRADFAAVIARELDRVAIEGNPDTTAGANEPRGILYTTGIGSVTTATNGSAPTRDHLIDLWKETAVDNADMGSLAYLMNAKTAAALRKTSLDSGSGRFVLEDSERVEGFRYFVSNAVPSDIEKGSGSNLSALVFGNFADLMVGTFSGLDILSDPYTGGTAGTLRVIVLQDADIAVRHPQSFAAASGIIAA